MKFESIRQIALKMEDVEESTSYGTPAFKTNGVLFARFRAELDSLVVAMSFDERELAIAEEPQTYYLIPHYLNYPWVLIRLSSVKPNVIRDLLVNAKRFASAKKKHKTRNSNKTNRRISRQ